jgi:hypothetical protein
LLTSGLSGSSSASAEPDRRTSIAVKTLRIKGPNLKLEVVRDVLRYEFSYCY